MREIVDGVIEIPIGFVHVHAIITDDGVVLVDTGLPGKTAKIEQALHEARRTIGDVRVVLLTHRHPDHIGNLAEVGRRSGARVVAHAADAGDITGESLIPPPSGLQRVISRFQKAPERAAVDEVLDADGAFSVPGFTALHTPGHTAGHISFLLDRGAGVLFVGDAAGGGKKLHGSPRMMSDDPAAAKASVARLAQLEFDVAVFGHGTAMKGRAVERFREYVSR